jgi:hypothetical protein
MPRELNGFWSLTRENDFCYVCRPMIKRYPVIKLLVLLSVFVGLVGQSSTDLKDLTSADVLLKSELNDGDLLEYYTRATRVLHGQFTSQLGYETAYRLLAQVGVRLLDQVQPELKLLGIQSFKPHTELKRQALHAYYDVGLPEGLEKLLEVVAANISFALSPDEKSVVRKRVSAAKMTLSLVELEDFFSEARSMFRVQKLDEKSINQKADMERREVIFKKMTSRLRTQLKELGVTEASKEHRFVLASSGEFSKVFEPAAGNLIEVRPLDFIHNGRTEGFGFEVRQFRVDHGVIQLQEPK